ncbi:hypothetical protein GLYMA_11G129432v4 [Glycine max]|nr:hypothetical protein GLYMA_11G129432v4 [Glycine max]KAH1158912.1 hypothetical protein GYH30_030893 [Glycine max]
MAPGRCSAWVNPNCTGGDSGTEPYIFTHNQLLAHASAVCVYKTKYQVSQKGLIGITLVANWYLPFSNTKADRKETERAIDFMFGWLEILFVYSLFSLHFNLSTNIHIHVFFQNPKNACILCIRLCPKRDRCLQGFI